MCRKHDQKEQEWAMNYLMTGERIREHRIRCNMSQDEVLDVLWKLGAPVSKTTYSGWENGIKHPTVYHLLALCKVFDCRPNDLIVTNAQASERFRRAEDV